MNDPDQLAAELARLSETVRTVQEKVLRHHTATAADLLSIRNEASFLLAKWDDRLDDWVYGDESVPFKKLPPLFPYQQEVIDQLRKAYGGKPDDDSTVVGHNVVKGLPGERERERGVRPDDDNERVRYNDYGVNLGSKSRPNDPRTP